MKFMLSGLAAKGEWKRLPEAERDQRVMSHQQALQQLVAERSLGSFQPTTAAPPTSAFLLTSVGLESDTDAVTLRRHNGEHVLVDGPFAETKEVLGGFDVIDFPSRGDAVEYAKRSSVREGQLTEIRPVYEAWWAYHGPPSGKQPLYLLMIATDERSLATRSQDALSSSFQEHQSVGLEYSAQKGVVRGESVCFSSARLCPSAEASTLRLTAGTHYLSDGPYAETKEVLGGYMLIECASQREAIEWAKKLAPREGDVLEIRPVRSLWCIYHG